LPGCRDSTRWLDPPLITFPSDYGHDDEFIGVCRGVIVRRHPCAVVVSTPTITTTDSAERVDRTRVPPLEDERERTELRSIVAARARAAIW